MMVPDEFDRTLRTALADVSAAVLPDPGLADRLVAEARVERTATVSPIDRGMPRRWVGPVLAAASAAAVVVAVAVVAHVLSGTHRAPALHPTTHAVPTPTPTIGPPPRPRAAAAPHFRAADVFFADTQHGWALGDARCATGSATDCPALLSTADGGRSWRRLPVPGGLVSTLDGASCGTNGTLAGPCVDAVTFADAADGYLWSLHELYTTHDGGRHWTRTPHPADEWAGAARLVVTGTSVVRLAPVQQCSSGCPGRLEVAAVGTDRWQVVRPTGAQIGLYSSTLAVAGGEVYLFAGGDEANASPGIFRSPDGGHNWSRVAAQPCGPAAGPQQDPFQAAGSVVADDGALIADCLSGVRVEATSATGFSGLRALPGGDQVAVSAARSARLLVAADTSRGYDPNPTGTRFFLTTDGGVHWQMTATLPVRGDGLRFASGTDGHAIAIDRRTVYVTQDGARTWQEVGFTR